MPRKLNLSHANLTDIVEEFGTPLQLYDSSAIVKNANTFINIFRKYFPTFKQYFAVKALPNPNILQKNLVYPQKR